VYEHRWYRWAAPGAVCLTAIVGVAKLRFEHHEGPFLDPGRTSVTQVHEFGGGTVAIATQRAVSRSGANRGAASVY
jgi:hypothetical protein